MTQRQDQRVSYSEALARLEQFQHLSNVIDARWLKQQYQLTVERYTLFTGWLSTSDFDWTYIYKRYTASLDSADAVLQAAVSTNLWSKLRSKIRTQSTRAESKGTLAELSLAVFLVQNGIDFDMEQRLDSASKKDVDFRLNFPGAMPVHIEVHWLSESEVSSRAADAGAPYGLVAHINFPYEEWRIRSKVAKKTPKLTDSKITLVALDCTSDPILGGNTSTIPDSLEHVFDSNIYTVLTKEESDIQTLVDGVIWFETDFETAITPVKRGYILNEHSPFRNDQSLLSWVSVWSSN